MVRGMLASRGSGAGGSDLGALQGKQTSIQAHSAAEDSAAPAVHLGLSHWVMIVRNFGQNRDTKKPRRRR